MTTTNNIAKLALAAAAALLLNACSKTSNSGDSTTATTPTTSTCSVNAQGILVNSNGTVCSSGTFTCPTSGFYVSNGQTIQCTAGQTVNINNTYPYGTNPTNYTNICQQYSNYYGTLYIPMILNNQYVCVNYDWLNSQAQGTAYYNNPQYYYYYPPYTSGTYGCGSASIYANYTDPGSGLTIGGDICL